MEKIFKMEKNIIKNDTPDNSFENSKELKNWKTPELKVLPVPTKTQGGAFNINDQDDVFYLS